MAMKETVLAIALSVGGSLISTSYQWGMANDKIATNSLAISNLQAKEESAQKDDKIQAEHNGKVEQALIDIQNRLDRIEHKL